jgi:hypothetical protein
MSKAEKTQSANQPHVSAVNRYNCKGKQIYLLHDPVYVKQEAGTTGIEENCTYSIGYDATRPG